MGKFLKPALYVALAVVVLLIGAIGWTVYTWNVGTEHSAADYAEAQAAVDRVYADYPVKVVKYRHFDFIKQWDEITLAAVEDRDLQVTISSYLDDKDLEYSRVDMKIRRDGEAAERWWGTVTEPPFANNTAYWRISGSGPTADFTTHDPYDWDQGSAVINIYQQELHITPADAPLITEALAAAAGHHDRLSIRLYHRADSRDPTAGVDYSLTVDAASSPTLADDLASVRAGRSVPGIEVLEP